MTLRNIKQIKNIKDKIFIIRTDYNVPMKANKIIDDTRVKDSLETLNFLLDKKAKKIIIVSHLGRPKGIDKKFTLAPIAKQLSKLLKIKVSLVADYKKAASAKSKIVLLENIRFDKREEQGSKQLAKELAQLADIFVFEAFSVAHRKHSSTYYLAEFLPTYAGLSFANEIKVLLEITKYKPKTIAVMGGAKISTKIKLIKNILPKVDYLLIGGALANNFLLANDLEIGQSMVEKEMLRVCGQIYQPKILIPIDVVVLRKNKILNIPASAVQSNDKIYDIGSETIAYYKEIIKDSKRIVWNGPMGYYEKDGFARGSYEIALEIAATKVRQYVGGGETMDIINYLNIAKDFYYISTGGGAMLTYLEEGSLPVLKKLK